MRIFSYLYTKVLTWSSHRHAPYYLAGVSLTESCIFPIPPDVMLASMTVAKPENAWWYAALTTLMSVIGGMLGYLLGMLFIDLLWAHLEYFGYLSSYQQVQDWFERWGVWVILVAGFSPVPYKLFTFGAGAMHMSFIAFVMASLIARGTRFFLVAGLLYLGGESLRDGLRRYIDWIGWLFVGLVVIGCIIYTVI